MNGPLMNGLINWSIDFFFIKLLQIINHFIYLIYLKKKKEKEREKEEKLISYYRYRKEIPELLYHPV